IAKVLHVMPSVFQGLAGFIAFHVDAPPLAYIVVGILPLLRDQHHKLSPRSNGLIQPNSSNLRSTAPAVTHCAFSRQARVLSIRNGPGEPEGMEYESAYCCLFSFGCFPYSMRIFHRATQKHRRPRAWRPTGEASQSVELNVSNRKLFAAS